MRFDKCNIRFVDSIPFFLQPLRKLSSTYNIDTIKGHFPHLFNRHEHPNYIGCIPDAPFVGVEHMNLEEYEYDFKPLYDQQQTYYKLEFQIIIYYILSCRGGIIIKDRIIF